MPIRKFRTLAEAGRARRIQPGTEEFSRALRVVFQLSDRFASSQKFPPGVYKFRSIEEAQAQKMVWMHRTPQK
jgi:hypothetical protein